MCLGFGIFLNCIKTPIEGSFYHLNSSFEERQEIWDKKNEEFWDYYEQEYSSRDFSNDISVQDSLKLVYKFNYTEEVESTKQLNVTVYNYTSKAVRFQNIGIYLSFRSEPPKYIYFDSSKHDTINSLENSTYSLVVDADFDFNDYIIFAGEVYDLNGNYMGEKGRGSFLYLYENELRKAKLSAIGDAVREQIGERPSPSNETDPQPDYMVKILNNQLAYTLLYIASGFLFMIAVISKIFGVILSKQKPSFTPMVKYVTHVVPVQPEIREVIIKEVHHAPKVHKVTCLHCGSRYKDNLDECPNCGSARIKEEKE